jgi:hypothetical protein
MIEKNPKSGFSTKSRKTQFIVSKCEICGRDSNGEYCEFHEKAYSNVLEKYVVWRDALGISWKEYLSVVEKNPYTGSWAKEVTVKLKRDLEENV